MRAPIPLAATLPRYPAPGVVPLRVLASPPSERWRVETLHAHPLTIEVTARSANEARTVGQLKLGVHRSLLDAVRL
jgi:hypothetical protein